MLENLIIFILFQVHYACSSEILEGTNFQTSISKTADVINDFSEVPDGDLETPNLLRKYGYTAEIHYVKTSDGYILQVQRLPKPGGKPFFLQHGLTDSSATFVLSGPKTALAYYLFELGYDVWLGNTRGNRYSRNHTKLNPDTNDLYWEFSWHEIGIYDLPAMIDYILNITKYKKLYYVGHSQGTTAFWVMCSRLPEYNNKIELMHALAPVAFMKHVPTRLKPFLGVFLKNPISKNIKEFPASPKEITVPLCRIFLNACVDFIFAVAGPDPKQFNLSMMPAFVSHMPAGCAIKQARHYFQLTESDRFCEFDYGIKENRKKYGKIRPISYDLKKITAPVILHYSLNDFLTSPIDVKRLSKLLGNCIGMHEIPIKEWNHIDFTVGIDARSVVYAPLINMTNNFEKGTFKKFC